MVPCLGKIYVFYPVAEQREVEPFRVILIRLRLHVWGFDLMVEQCEVAPSIVDSLHSHPLLMPLAHSLAERHPLGPGEYREKQ